MRDTDEPVAAEISSSASDGAAAGRVADIVAAHLVPVTRFARADIRHLGEETAFPLALTLELRQSVTFEAEHHTGADRLDDGITVLGGAFAVSTQIHRALNQAKAGVAEALQLWAECEPEAYRRRLQEAAAFIGAPGRYGHEYTCECCVGQRQVGCAACGGAGQTVCPPCAGSGRVACPTCQGARHLACSSCAGRGSWSASITTQRWDAARGEHVTDYTTEYQSCAACGATGQATCPGCDYLGQVSCGACQGQGQHLCAPCQASGKVDCASCLASGVQHAWSTVRAHIASSETLDIHSEDEGLRALVEHKMAREELPGYGALLDVRHSVLDGQLDSRYRLRLDVIKAPLSAARRDFVVYGFGPGPAVLDFANIAGHLLEDDLVELERGSEQACRWRHRRGAALITAARRFVESELNLLVAEQQCDQSITTAQAAGKVEQQYKGLVNATYVARASGALREAFGSLYGAELAEPVLYQCALVALLTALMYGFGWPRAGAWPAIACGLGLAVLGWRALEWRAQARMRRIFPGRIGERALCQLESNCTVKRWRLAILLAGGVAVFGAVGLAAQVPAVERAQEARGDAELMELELTRWATQPVRDLRQRSYPPTELLTAFAERGDTRAQLVLVWQQLLGAGAEKDLPAAARWLAKAPASLDADPLWLSARAVLQLSRSRQLKEIRAASKQLAQAAGQGLVEARYWEARCYLDEDSPLRDIKLGTDKLTQAADAGHGHAALELAKMYGRGRNGLRRDMGKARHYLAIAREERLGADLL